MSDDTTPSVAGEPRGLERRELLRRGLIGGALVWSAPAVVTALRPATAWANGTGSPFPGDECTVKRGIKYDMVQDDSGVIDFTACGPVGRRDACRTGSLVNGCSSVQSAYLTANQFCVSIDGPLQQVSCVNGKYGQNDTSVHVVTGQQGDQLVCIDLLSGGKHLSAVQIVFCTAS